MISRSSHSEREPFLLKPAGKDYLWGGSRLNEEFHKGIEMSPLAETWECSTHPDGLSVITSGVYAGKTLKEVLALNPEFLGTKNSGYTDLPILVKFIDAKEDLSIQVHPDDAYAAKLGQRGKTEMWYVIDSTPSTLITYGFQRDITKEKIREILKSDSIEKYLQRVRVRNGDIFYIEAGTVHAIGKGALIAEIQENSNLTYRLYDYNRVGTDGKKRELHINEALEVIKTKASKEPRQPLRVMKYVPGCAYELLCRCQYFEVNRMLVNTANRPVLYQSDRTSYKVLLCIGGNASIFSENLQLYIRCGDCVFFPAESVITQITGNAQFLDIKG